MLKFRFRITTAVCVLAAAFAFTTPALAQEPPAQPDSGIVQS
jgi:hypothetical protein